MIKDFSWTNDFYFYWRFLSFNLFIYVSNAAWFIYFNKTYLYILSGICVSLQLAYIFYAKANESRNNLFQSRVKIPIAFSYILLFISVSLMIFSRSKFEFGRWDFAFRACCIGSENVWLSSYDGWSLWGICAFDSICQIPFPFCHADGSISNC